MPPNSDVLCDICNKRPAVVRVRVSRNGKEETLNLCSEDYERLQVQSRLSPFESMLGDTFGKNFPSAFHSDFDDLSSDIGYPLPRQRESTDLSNYFSNHTKELIEEAAKIAVSFHRRELDTEHLLHAIARSEVVKEIFKQFKISPEDVIGYIEANAPKGTGKEDVQDLGVSPRVKSVFESAFAIAKEMGHGYIGPEHLLAGLLQEDDGLAGNLLKKYGLTPESLRQKLVKVVGRGAEEGRVESASTTPNLDKYSRDLSKLSHEGKLDPVIGRHEEIETAVEILSRRTKNNPVLIGEPGVGKTAIVEGLAQRITHNEVPESLQDKRVIELSLNSLVAGSKFRGELEERTKALVDEIIAHKEELIIFIDEIHTIVSAGSGGDEGGLNISNVLKPHLARGEMHLIGATTLSEYQKYIEKDSALERRFQPIFVSEPTPEQAIEILRGLRDRYEAHHKVKILDESIIAAVELSDRYISNRFLPDKAIDLIDQAASRVRIGLTSRTRKLKDIDEKIRQHTREAEYSKTHKAFDEAKRHEKEIKKLEEARNKAEAKWQNQKGSTTLEVRATHIAEVVSKITGIPVTELTEEERQKLLKMEERLHERVIGQEEAVTAVSDAVRRSRAGLSASSRPIATFLFLGPTGVGKTELARSLAWVVFGDESAIVRLDMSEYMERHAVSRLVGAPPGYIGYDEGGQLTEAVRRRPYAVILLDEIEKAHPDVYNILLQVLDDGRLTDGKGRVIDFTNTMIIATSNIGSDIIQENLEKQKKGYEELKSELLTVLRNYFKPEFLNRIDDIIVFHALSKKQSKSIVALQLEKVRRLAHGQGLILEFDPSVFDYLVEIGYSQEFGARELKRAIQNEIENKLAREVLKGTFKEGDRITVRHNKKEKIVLEKSVSPRKKKQKK